MKWRLRKTGIAALIFSLSLTVSAEVRGPVDKSFLPHENCAGSVLSLLFPNINDICLEPHSFGQSEKPQEVPAALPTEEIKEILPFRKRYRRSRQRPLDNWYNTRYYTMAPDVNVKGPVYDRILSEKQGGAYSDEAQEYVRQVFRWIVYYADQHARNHAYYGHEKESNNNYSYYSYLITALATVHHESQLMHMRKNFVDRCVVANNDLSNAGKKNSVTLKEIFKRPDALILPDCHQMAEDLEKVTHQLLAAKSGNHTNASLVAVGVMMINPWAHEYAVQPEIVFDTPRFIQAGMDILSELYDYLWISDQDVELLPGDDREKMTRPICSGGNSFSSDPFAKAKYRKDNAATDAKKIYDYARGTWATYHSGFNSKNPKRTYCRYEKAERDDDGNCRNEDCRFQESLDAILKVPKSIYHRYLPKNSIERRAFLEIVSNFKAAFTPDKKWEKQTNAEGKEVTVAVDISEPEQNENLFYMLDCRPGIDHNCQGFDAEPWEGPGRYTDKKRYEIGPGVTPLMTLGENSLPLACGSIDVEEGQSLRVSAEDAIQAEEVLSLIRLPKYSDANIHLFSKQIGVKLIGNPGDDKIVDNVWVRSDTFGDTSTELFRVVRNNKGLSPVYEFVKKVSPEESKNGKAWYKIQIPNGGYGYISVKGLTETTTLKSAPDEQCENKSHFFVPTDRLVEAVIPYGSGGVFRARVTSSTTTTFYEFTGSYYPVVALSDPGSEVTVVGDNRGKVEEKNLWYKVKFHSESGAYYGWAPWYRLEMLERVGESE